MQKFLLWLLKLATRGRTGKKEWQHFFQILYKAGLQGMNYGAGSEIEHSGEKWVLQYLEKQIRQDGVFVDAGAKYGDYSMLLTKKFPQGKIYTFEPSRANFEILKDRLLHYPKITIANIALGEMSTKTRLYLNEQYPGLAGFYQRNLSHIGLAMDNSEEVEVISLDEFCSKQQIEKIDFLKIDTEGSELEILNGASKLMARDCLDYIQFEFGGCNIDSSTWFRDFFYKLSPKYNIFRILQNGLQPIEKYSEKLEIFLTANFLAIHKSLN